MASFSDEVNAFLGNASSSTGVPQSTLQTLLSVENGGANPSAVSSGNAQGLFQFTPGTWNQYGNGGNIFDPQASATAAGTYWNSIQSSLTSALGGAPQDWQTYLGYQQGPGTAATLLGADPNAPVSQFLSSQAVTGNGGDYSGTVGQFLSHVQDQWVKGGGTASGATPTSGSSASSSGILGSFFGSFQSLFVRASVFIVGLIFIWAGLRLFGNRGSFTPNPEAFRAQFSATKGANRAGGSIMRSAPAPKRSIFRETEPKMIGETKPKAAPKPKAPRAPRAPRAPKPTVEHRTLHADEGARPKTKYGPKV